MPYEPLEATPEQLEEAGILPRRPVKATQLEPLLFGWDPQFRFRPQDDITAGELSTVLVLVANLMAKGDHGVDVQTIIQAEGIARHFEVVEPPTTTERTKT